MKRLFVLLFIFILAACVPPTQSELGYPPPTYTAVPAPADIANLLQNRPEPGESVEITAYFSGADPFIMIGGIPEIPQGQVICPSFINHTLTDRPFLPGLAVLNSSMSNILPDDAFWLIAASPESIENPGQDIAPKLPYHARLRGHLNDPGFAHCQHADRIFVVDGVIATYAEMPPGPTGWPQKPTDFPEWLRYDDRALGFSLAYPPDWTVESLAESNVLGGVVLRPSSKPNYPVAIRIHEGETHLDQYDPASEPPLLQGVGMSVFEQGWSLGEWPDSQHLPGFVIDREAGPGKEAKAVLFSSNGRTYEIALTYPSGFEASQELLTQFTALVESFRLDVPPAPSPTPPIKQALEEIAPTPDPSLTATPAPPDWPTPAPTPTQWQTFTSQEYGFSLHYPPGWTPVTTLPNQVSLVHAGDSIALRFMVRHVAEDVNLVRSGVSAGRFVPREPVTFIGPPISNEVLVYQSQDKAVFYAQADEITRGDLVFVITLESNRLDYEAIDIPPEVQAEADAIVASAELVTDEASHLPEMTDLALLYNQYGRLFRFNLDSVTDEPFDLPAPGDIRDALFNRDGRYLAFTDEAGLNLYDIVTGESQLWLSGSLEPWERFVPRAWNNGGRLLVQRIWGTENSTPGWAEIGDDGWHPLPLPNSVTADYYGLDSGAAWSPDGAQLALGGYDYAIPSNVPGLSVINLETGTAQRIVTHMIASGIEGGDPLVAGAYDPAWSPDGEWIAFGLEEDTTESLNFPVRLYLVRPDGAALTPLTDNEQGQASQPLWTANGNLIYSLTGSNKTANGIYAYDLSAGKWVIEHRPGIGIR